MCLKFFRQERSFYSLSDSMSDVFDWLLNLEVFFFLNIYSFFFFLSIEEDGIYSPYITQV